MLLVFIPCPNLEGKLFEARDFHVFYSPPYFQTLEQQQGQSSQYLLNEWLSFALDLVQYQNCVYSDCILWTVLHSSFAPYYANLIYNNLAQIPHASVSHVRLCQHKTFTYKQNLKFILQGLHFDLKHNHWPTFVECGCYIQDAILHSQGAKRNKQVRESKRVCKNTWTGTTPVLC